MLKGLKTLMNAIISEVKPNSIAWEFELESGDKIIKVNDKEIPDLIDFNFETATNEYTLTVEKKETGEIEVLEIEKDDDLGYIVSGKYDYSLGGRWNNSYVVTDLLPSGSMIWTVKDDMGDVSKYVRCDGVPSDIVEETEVDTGN